MNRKLSIEELVEEVNKITSQLETKSTDSRMASEITVRKVRYLLTNNMVDKPKKEGRNIYFTQDHVNQIVAIRKLQLDGLSEKYISSMLNETEDNNHLNSLSDNLFIGSNIQPQGNSSIDNSLNKDASSDALSVLRSISGRTHTNSFSNQSPKSLLRETYESTPIAGSMDYMKSLKTRAKFYEEYPLDTEGKLSLKMESGYVVKDPKEVLERIKQILNITGE